MIFWSTSVWEGEGRGGQEGGGGVGSMGGRRGGQYGGEDAVWGGRRGGQCGGRRQGGGGVAGGGYLGTIRMLPVALCELRMFLL